MPQQKQQPHDASELLADIHHVNQANKAEIKRIKDRLRQRVAEADLAGDVAKSIIGEVSSQLGQLSAKVKLAEKAIRSIRREREPKPVVVTTKNKTGSNGVSLQFSVDQLAGNRNLLPIESSGSGTSYLWSGSDPEILFVFPLDRSKPIGMQIRLFALIKPEYLKQLKVLIDGTHIKHRISVDERLFVVSCNLPPSGTNDQTDIKIILPATHSPKELGTSNDERKLGVAINEIRFGKPGSGFDHLLKKLKIRS